DLTHLGQQGAEVVRGDATSEQDLRALFAEGSAALVLLPENVADPDFVENREVMSRAIRDALRAERLSHVVALSTVGAERADAPGPPGGLHSFEQDLAELESANLLLLRSATYLDYLLAALPMITAQKINGSAIEAGVRIPMVATADVAREAAERLTKRDFDGHQVKVLLGPEDVTMAEATRAIGQRLGMPDLPYVEFPPDGVRAALREAGMSEQVAGLLVDLQLALNSGRYYEGVERTEDSTMPTRLDDFLRGALPEPTVEQAEAAR
ncbi:MAG TPA: NAD(P)H-binding protein, partial [Actinomycetota bacterium]|nr:NAD(P)H-binding protein [Actinomycetota bacterium]